MKVVVLYGDVPPDAPSDEQDTLVEVDAVSGALTALGYEPVRLPVTLDLKKAADSLLEIRPSFVFNLVESLDGKGRLIHLAPSLLDHLRVPYTGSSTEALFLTSNKPSAKKIFDSSGIPTPKWVFPPRVSAENIPGSRYILKSAWEHASIGIGDDSVVSPKSADDLLQTIERHAVKLGGECFAEEFIEGREFNLSVIDNADGPEVCPPAEIHFIEYPDGKLRIVDYRAKWDEGSFEYENTPRSFEFPESDGPLLKELSDIAVNCWKAFGLRGYARVDFRVDRLNRPWVLEVNANPCITPYGGFIAAAGQAGLSYDQAVERIVQAALKGIGM